MNKPSTLEYAELSDAVYSGTPPLGYVLIEDGSFENPETGFYGQVYKNEWFMVHKR